MICLLTVVLLLLSFGSSVHSSVTILPLSGTWLDVAYDGRLKYANTATPSYSCADWGLKVNEMYSLGIRLIIFQAVHDARFGAYYTSTLPFMTPWPGKCPDVVEAVMSAADALPSMQVLLSAEYYGTEADPTSNSTVMAGRLAIMAELAATHVPQHGPSFAGWYFSAEAYLTPYFVPSFFDYIGNLTSAALHLTPGKLIFISPYNTRFATSDPTFSGQLARLGAMGVSAIAYQDEVGCVRDELPVATVCGAWRALTAAHAAAGPGAPQLWANVESFTWEDGPNNSSSALIPTALPRLLAQLRCAAAAGGVRRVVTFTVEAMLEVRDSPAPWGPPSGDAVRLREEYLEALQVINATGNATNTVAAAAAAAVAVSAGRRSGSYPATALRVAAIVQGAVEHEGVGASVTHLVPSPLPPPPAGGGGGGGGGGPPSALADGLTGMENPYTPAWVAFPLGAGPATTTAGTCLPAVEFVLDLHTPLCFGALGAHALQVPAGWWEGGSGAQRVQRNVSASLPQAIQFSLSNASATGPWTPAATAQRPTPWAQEIYDLRADVLAVAMGAGAGVGAAGGEGGAPPTQQQWCARFVHAVVTPGKAPQGATQCPLILLSEVFVLKGL